jgi:sialate O-acetylesterase
VNRAKQIITFLAISLILCSTFVSAQVELPAVISDNMVLQQQFEAPIWGWAKPGEKISVTASWDQKEVTTTADKDGKWMVKLETSKATTIPQTITINETVLKNILIGEVWICSGQSNMWWPLSQTMNADKEIAAANYPEIRLFYVAREFADEPKKNCYGKWTDCNPQTAANFSAVAYFFGRELHQQLGVPIGLIHTSWGGTPAEAWTRKEVLQSDPELAVYLKRFEEKIAASEPGVLPINQGSPSGLYNAMIAPLIPFGIRGAIWYQGESNTKEAKLYEKLFPAMISNWRSDWEQGDFPFYFAQIAPYNYETPMVCALLRDAQRKSLAVPNTGMAVTLDIGDPNDIHPRNKQEVGKRLALWALAKDYGKQNIVYSGPLYKSMKIEKNKIRLLFDYVGKGLVAKGGELTHFEMAGEDRQFFPAGAKIDGKTIVVSSKQVKNPLAVRFAFQNTDEPNLFNKEGLPASSFRTDDWEIVTERVLISGKFDPASDEFVVTMKCELNPLEIRYTTDGSEPAKTSKLYSDALRFKESIELKARAFQGDISSVSVAENKFVRHLANGKKIKLTHPYSSRYPAGGDDALVNGIRGSDNFRDGNWQGFEGDDLFAVIDMGEQKEIRSISTGFIQVVNSWAFFPRTVEYAVSQDGQNYQTVATVTNDVPDNQPGNLIKEFAAKFSDVSARYVRVKAKNIGVCPDWHAGAGGKARLFVDEVVVE